MIFNAPLAMFGVADWVIKNQQFAQAVKRWSAMDQFRDFERGVVSLSGITYFIMIAVVMLYICMVLIGRRHWSGREDEKSIGLHYAARALGLVALAIGVNLFLAHHNLWWMDVTSERLNKASPSTTALLRQMRGNKDAKSVKSDA